MTPDFTTIEHDFIHMKEYFSNYKFTYKERRSKLDFLQNISNEPAQDTSALIASSKEQLVEVKNVYKNADSELKELSKDLNLEEEKLRENQNELNLLVKEEEELRQKLAKLNQMNDSIFEYEKLKTELDQLESEINKIFLDSEITASLIDPSIVEAKKNEEIKLREERNDLAAKQRRLTIINTDNFIEDIYCWNRGYLDILEKIFGLVTIAISGDKFTIKVSKNESFLEIIVKSKKFIECYLSKNQRFETLQEFEKIKEYCLVINDIKPLLLFFAQS